MDGRRAPSRSRCEGCWPGSLARPRWRRTRSGVKRRPSRALPGAAAGSSGSRGCSLSLEPSPLCGGPRSRRRDCASCARHRRRHHPCTPRRLPRRSTRQSSTRRCTSSIPWRSTYPTSNSSQAIGIASASTGCPRGRSSRFGSMTSSRGSGCSRASSLAERCRCSGPGRFGFTANHRRPSRRRPGSTFSSSTRPPRRYRPCPSPQQRTVSTWTLDGWCACRPGGDSGCPRRLAARRESRGAGEMPRGRTSPASSPQGRRFRSAPGSCRWPS